MCHDMDYKGLLNDYYNQREKMRVHSNGRIIPDKRSEIGDNFRKMYKKLTDFALLITGRKMTNYARRMAQMLCNEDDVTYNLDAPQIVRQFLMGHVDESEYALERAIIIMSAMDDTERKR